MPSALQYLLGSGQAKAAPEKIHPKVLVAAKDKQRSPRTKQLAANQEFVLPDLPRRPMPTYQLDVPIPPFPTAADVRTGMRRDDILAKFGEPDAFASWSEEGMLREKLIYRSGKRSTEIVIQGGRVISSSSDTSALSRRRETNFP